MRTIQCLLVVVFIVCCCQMASATTAQVCGDPSLPIPDGGAPDTLAIDTLTLDTDLTISDVRVEVEITHAWIGDLGFGVVSPAGTGVLLYDGAGGDEDDIDVIFWDAGFTYDSKSWVCACEVKPSGPGVLSDFDGEQSAGDWLLVVGDSTLDYEGTLNHWCVDVAGCLEYSPADLDCQLHNGNHPSVFFGGVDPKPDILDLYRNGELYWSLSPSPSGDGLLETYLSAGVYIYTLVATDFEGCSNTVGSCTFEIGKLVERCTAGSETISYFSDPVISTVEIYDDVPPSEIAVSVDISHTWDGDLVIAVESPDGVSITLFDKSLGSPDTDQHDMVLTYLDGGAAHASVPLTCGCYMEPVVPDTMSDLIGESAAGTWTLTVSDVFEDDDGVLNDWCVDIYHEPVFVRGDVDGNGHFSGLSDSLYLLRYAFTSGAAPPCMEAADADANGYVDGLNDTLRMLNHAFLGGPPLAAPYPECGPEDYLYIGCDTEPDCS